MTQLRFAYWWHAHGEHCFARTADGRPYAYTPCRADGLDRNLRAMNPVDVRAPYRGLQLTCSQTRMVQS